KIPDVIAHVNDVLESGSKVVVFAHHRDVIHAFMGEWGEDAVYITGETGMQSRQDAVDRFQSDPECRLFVGNIQAAGVGLTLTASAHVIFAELDWVPGNVTQAEDRCIAQGEPVLTPYGWKPIEEIRVGDQVITRNGG